MSLTGTQPGKRRPLAHHVGKKKGVDDSAKSPELYATLYWWNGWETGE